MVTIEVFRPLYSFSKSFLKNYFNKLVTNEFKELDVTINLKLEKNKIIFSVDGEDWEIVKNFISQKFVVIKNINEVKKGMSFNGFLNSVGNFGYGNYVDIGIRKFIKKDLLIPLFNLRKNFFSNKKIPLRSINNYLGFIDNLAVKVEVLDIDYDENKIMGNFTSDLIDQYNNWIRNDNEILIFCGVTLTKIQKTFKELEANKYLKDLIILDNFEHAVILEDGTTAKGILAKVGKHFKNEISLLNPVKVRESIGSS